MSDYIQLNHDVNLLEKEIRAKCVKDYMQKRGLTKCVCFSCGNASAALKAQGVDVVDISPVGDLVANRWWRMYEIANAFHDHFDATSGHLPIELMNEIAVLLRKELSNKIKNGTKYGVHSGSGETLVCLSIAFPFARYKAIYGDGIACEYSKDAPLNAIVELITRGKD